MRAARGRPSRRVIPAAALAASLASAVAATPSPTLAASLTAAQTRTPSMTVIASGLDNPRGLNFGPDGVLYVAEAGRGGPGPCIVGAQNQTFCLGPTGAVTAVSKGGQRRVVTGLPSLGTPNLSEVLGAHDVAATHGGLLIPVGLGTDPARRAQLGRDGAAIATLVKASGKRWRSVADLGAYEAANDPDQGQPGTGPDSQPYAVLPHGSGALVVDAGANDLLRVGPGGRISTVAVFDVRLVPGPGGGEVPMHPVPTSVARGPDGALYAGQLTGFPFPVGGAGVWRLAPGEPPAVYASGFTNIVDITFDRRGRLLVLEIAANGLLSGDPAGALHRVERDGTRTLIAGDGLFTPTGVAAGPDGAYYVSNKGTLAGSGEVLRISGQW
ncbi:ScyD/ScyE family protein [Nonomuraea sp. PA05]|uniref:ScyD/ScyE family protein n=1 Tax=Nonomuraea sp. PA05 TaxID=2604466 RepID=UPI0011D38941|nr:ScyD/ScyE family protein [Nonomuraea sp. PA05]TYB50841.1 ScyD/ScyE family protein [Nonomuraea sp. PA05]